MQCLSLDIDWAHAAVIAGNVKATWFVSHATPLIADIRRAGGHEIGVAPTCKRLLLGKTGAAEAFPRRVLSMAPGAKSVRSHSLTRSSKLSPLDACEIEEAMIEYRRRALPAANRFRVFRKWP